MPITFAVDNVSVATGPLKTIEAKKVIESKAKGEVEACSNIQLASYGYGGCLNGLVTAVHAAFDGHRPLSLTPDSFWLTISSGLATHINLNAEQLRHRFVNFEGKERIVIDENGFVKGSPNNNWEGTFGKFSAALEGYIGKKRDLIVSDFSTTGPVEKAASEVVLMDAMQSYFDYCVRTLCGFPTITLEGEVEDWENLRHRVHVLREFGLDSWIDHLEPVIDKVVESAKGNVDKDFWRSFLKINGGSGGPFVSGWINTLFPYLAGHNGRPRPNSYVDWAGHGGWGGGPNPGDYPVGLSSVPFEWEYHDQKFDMSFIGGVVGMSQSEDLILRPEAGWAIKERKTQEV